MKYINTYNEKFNNSDKFPVTNDGRMGLNLEFKYNSVVYYINTNDRSVKTEQYADVEVIIPMIIRIPNINTIEDNTSGKDFSTKIANLERSLEVDNDKYKELQLFLKSINWELERNKIELKNKMLLFLEDYGESELLRIINDLNILLK